MTRQKNMLKIKEQGKPQKKMLTKWRKLIYRLRVQSNGNKDSHQTQKNRGTQ